MQLVHGNYSDQKFDGYPVYLLCVFRDEAISLPYFMQYYQELGVTHFIMVDNGSEDEGAEFLKSIPNINLKLFLALDSFREALCGIRWVNILLDKFCVNQYCLVVDVDELFTFDLNQYVNIQELIQVMENTDCNVIGATLLDMYPKVLNNDYKPGDKFIDHSAYFDAWNEDFYTVKKKLYKNFYWITGGLRARLMKTDNIIHKLPFFKYNFQPLRLNMGTHFFHYKRQVVFDADVIRLLDQMAVLLHFKFVKPNFIDYLDTQISNNEHWNDSIEYKNYKASLSGEDALHFYDENYSKKFDGLEDLSDFFDLQER